METINAVKSVETCKCAHCYTVIPSQTQAINDSQGRQFCCQGCRIVYQAISSCDLGEYYKLRDSYLSDIKPANETQSTFDYLDLPEIQDSFTTTPNTLRFYVGGVQCAACIWILEKIPTLNSNIRSVHVNLLTRIAEVEWTHRQGIKEFAEITSRFGYAVSPLKPNESGLDLSTQENRSSLKRLAIAAFCSGNIMLLSSANYFDVDPQFGFFFNLLSMFLMIPIVFYAGRSIFSGAWGSIHSRTPSVDVPLAIAALGGIALSLINLLKGTHETYFDSVSILITLILASRYLASALQTRYLKMEIGQNRILPLVAKVIDGELPKLISSGDILPGYKIEVNAGDVVPADGTITCGSGNLNESILTGESLPRLKIEGQAVFAGATLVEGRLILTATQTQHDSWLSQLHRNSLQTALQKSPFNATIERWNLIFTFAIVTLALLTSAYWYFAGNLESAFNRMFTMLVVACPCALAFGIPLVYARAIYITSKIGFTLKSGEIFRRIFDIKNVVFDKTGTLTEGLLKLEGGGDNLSDHQKSDIVQIEIQVRHPIAQALTREWGSKAQVMREIESIKMNEFIGFGVEALVGKTLYRLQKSSEESDLLAVDVFCDNQLIDTLYFSDTVKKDAKYVVEKLKKLGLNLFILSGDKSARVKNLARELNLELENAYGDCSPQDKETFIKQNSGVMMIGDGINDAGALARSHLGIVIGGALENALQIGEVFLPQGPLVPIFELFQIHQLVFRALNSIKYFSIIYNCTTAALAFFGYINPLVAALLMPVSSLSVIAIANLSLNYQPSKKLSMESSILGVAKT